MENKQAIEVALLFSFMNRALSSPCFFAVIPRLDPLDPAKK